MVKLFVISENKPKNGSAGTHFDQFVQEKTFSVKGNVKIRFKPSFGSLVPFNSGGIGVKSVLSIESVNDFFSQYGVKYFHVDTRTKNNRCCHKNK